MNEELRREVIAALDILLLERQPNGDLLNVGATPDWFPLIFSADVWQGERLALENRFFFLENFLIDAEKFWNSGIRGRLRSGVWTEVDRSGEEWNLEAYAVNVGSRRLLLIERLFDEERKALIQKARERSLDLHRIGRAREELRKKEARLRALLDDFPDWILRCHKSGRLLDLKVSGVADQTPFLELIGRHLSDLLPEQAAQMVMKSIWKTRATGKTHSVVLHLGMDGHNSCEARIAPCGDEDLLIILRDLQEPAKESAE